MNLFTNTLVKLGLLKEELDYYLLRAGTVIACLFLDISKWFDYERLSSPGFSS
jgi:hypothetical protein